MRYTRAVQSVAQRMRPPETPAYLGPYRIVALLGRGGMGIVYQAEHQATGQQVAIKIAGSSHVSVLSSIRREGSALSRIDHPGVVRIYDQGVDAGLPWYAMELLGQRTLADHLAELMSHSSSSLHTITRTNVPSSEVTAQLPPPAGGDAEFRPQCFGDAGGGRLAEMLELARALCDALACVHGTALVHGDLKPSNVFLRQHGTPVLVDFGLAVPASGMASRDAVAATAPAMGTPTYMSPEQIYGEAVDARVDLYALGCILYECVTGSPPFLGSLASVLQQHLSRPPDPPSHRVANVPPELDALILALLAKRPQDRPGYAADVAQTLARLCGHDAAAVRPRTPAYLCRSSLVGRTAVIERLDEHLRQALAARGALVMVGGPSGIGKTRLMMEAVSRAVRFGLRVVASECATVAVADDAGASPQAAPLHPFRNLLLAIAEYCQREGPAEAKRILSERGAVLAAHEPALGRLVSYNPAAVTLPELSTAAARMRLHQCLADTLAAFARDRPLLVVLDDLQWADETSLGFLHSLDPSWFEATGVLFLGTYRTEALSSNSQLLEMLASSSVARIDLDRLDASDIEQMMGDMLASRTLSPALLDAVVHKSQGNPFFVAEYLRVAIADAELYRNAAGQWQVLPHDSAALQGWAPPGSGLRDLVLRQMSGLEPEGCVLARMAAVLGREFDAELLSAVMRLQEASALDAVEQLCQRQILEMVGPRLRFVHDKLREIIYAEIPERERPQLHGAAGEAIEERYVGTGELPSHYPSLAHHFTRSGTDAKACQYLGRAGEQALTTGASAEALTFLRQALELDQRCRGSGRPPLGPLILAGWQQLAGRAAANLGRFAEAEQFSQMALHRLMRPPKSSQAIPDVSTARSSLAKALLLVVAQLVLQLLYLLGLKRPHPAAPIERQRLARAAHTAEQLAQIYFFQGETLRAFLCALQACNLAELLGPSPELARGYASLNTGFYAIPLPRLAEVYKRRARAVAQATADPQARCWVSFLCGVTDYINASWEAARSSLAAALEIARDIQDHRRAEECLGLLGDVEMQSGHLAASLQVADELYQLASKSGDVQGQLWGLSARGECLSLLGRDAEALEMFERYRALCQPGMDDLVERITFGAAALAQLRLGAIERARTIAEDTLTAIASRAASSFNLLPGYLATAEVLLALWAQAETPAERAALMHSAGRATRMVRRYARAFPVGRPYAYRFSGLYAILRGQRARAKRAFARSLAAATRLAVPVAAALAHHELGRLCAAGSPGRCHHEREAERHFAALGMRNWQRER